MFQVSFRPNCRLYTTGVEPGMNTLLTRGIDLAAEKTAQNSATTISGDSELRADLFIEIVRLEFALRDLVKQTLGKQYNGGWESQVPPSMRERWEKRLKKDLDESLPPEQELLNYADFSDY